MADDPQAIRRMLSNVGIEATDTDVRIVIAVRSAVAEFEERLLALDFSGVHPEADRLYSEPPYD